MRSLLFLLFVFIGLGVTTRVLEAKDPNPSDVILDIASYSKDVMDPKKGKKARKTIEGMVDFSAIARNSLGEYWPRLKGGDRSAFSRLLKEIIGRTVFPKAPEFFRNTNIKIEKQKFLDSASKKAYVKSLVTHKKKKAIVEYWLEKRARAGWQVVDLAIEEERWVENLNEQFLDIIDEFSYTELKKRMQKKLAELKQKKEY